MNLRVRAHVRAREGNRGHILARHHPDLTDQQLRDRLTTGLDTAGHVAPTTGVSSRFSSEALFRETLASVQRKLDACLRATERHLVDNLQDLAQALHTVANTPPGPALGLAHQELNQKRLDLVMQVRTTTGCMRLLPVYYTAARQRVELYEIYTLKMHHNRQLGTGFQGTQPQAAVVQGKNVTLYGNTMPFQGPAEHTVTVIIVKGKQDRALARSQDVRQWDLLTHCPTYLREEEIEYRGED